MIKIKSMVTVAVRMASVTMMSKIKVEADEGEVVGDDDDDGSGIVYSRVNEKHRNRR